MLPGTMEVTNQQHTEEIQYLRAASPELREALVHISAFMTMDTANSVADKHIAVRTAVLLRANPQQALLALPQRRRQAKAGPAAWCKTQGEGGGTNGGEVDA